MRENGYRSFSQWAKANREALIAAAFHRCQTLDPNFRKRSAYRTWRRRVIARDGHRCAHCGDDRASRLQVHHIVPVCMCFELRYAPFNGVVLCRRCHTKDFRHQLRLKFWLNLQRDLKKRG